MAHVSWPSLPPWLEAMQDAFGRTVRRPLDRSSGQLRARPELYDAELVAATTASARLDPGERLAVYNRQYWMRLFTVLHGAYPLLARLLGYWELNRCAEAYLTAQPPRSWDLDAIVPGFAPFFQTSLDGSVFEVARPPRRLPSRALREAADLDAAHHRVFRAPQEAGYQPAPDDGVGLLQAQLRFVANAALARESWDLLDLRRQALALTGEELLSLGEALPEPRAWLLLRREHNLGVVPLAPREAELLTLLCDYPVAEALGRLEERCSPAERAALPEQARQWLSRSMRLGLWARPDTAQK
jgi:Putative DNA-binding domain